jgi:hypothetical protein
MSQTSQKQIIDFSRYPDREVICLGIPYPRSKLVNGKWYRRMINGEYLPFTFQNRVQEVPPGPDQHLQALARSA